MLAFDPSTGNPDSASWLPGAQFNIAYCALRSARCKRTAGASCPGRVTGAGARGGSNGCSQSGGAGGVGAGGGAGACASEFQTGVGRSSNRNPQPSSNDSSSSSGGSTSNSFGGPFLPSVAASGSRGVHCAGNDGSWDAFGSRGSNCAGSDALWGEDACDPMRPAIVWAEESSPCE
ncbi:hypothetical protein DUNSADRAFT_3484, partial [Dunaliella salina]